VSDTRAYSYYVLIELMRMEFQVYFKARIKIESNDVHITHAFIINILSFMIGDIHTKWLHLADVNDTRTNNI